MKLFYAKMWLKKYLLYNKDKFDEQTFTRELNRKIVNLSHRVYKTHGMRGHNIRQNIRKELWMYCKNVYPDILLPDKYSAGYFEPKVKSKITYGHRKQTDYVSLAIIVAILGTLIYLILKYFKVIA